MAYATIIYTKKDHIASITLNQPETDNIINRQLAQELEDICCGINHDDNIYLVVITGAGDRAFCGGSELERLIQAANTVEASPAKLKDVSTKYNVARAVASIEQPVIAAINGDALGGGAGVSVNL